MARILDFDRYKSAPMPPGKRGPAGVSSVNDYKLLGYHARNGISVNEYLKMQQRTLKRAKVTVGTLIGTAAATALIGLSNPDNWQPYIRPSTAEETLVDYFVRFGFQ